MIEVIRKKKSGVVGCTITVHSLLFLLFERRDNREIVWEYKEGKTPTVLFVIFGSQQVP